MDSLTGLEPVDTLPGMITYCRKSVATVARLVGNRRSGPVFVLFALALTIGCSSRTVTQFEVIDYRSAGDVVRYMERFEPGVYESDADANVDVVLTREKRDPDDPSGEITQVIHVRSIWRSIPGVTIADRSQINAEVSYYIVSGDVGQSFEGAGSVIYTVDEETGAITGTLELARLKPVRQLLAGDDLFERVDLSGTFEATENRRRVRETIHEMSRRFGPRPR